MRKALQIHLIMIVILLIASPSVFSESVKLKFNTTIDLLNNENVIYKRYTGIFAPMNTFIDFELVDINLNDKKLKILPAMPDSLQTVEEIAKKHNAIAAMNAGFFDSTNAMSVSYVVINGEVVGNPEKDTNLTSNTSIKPFLKDIYNRVELKIYDCNDSIKYYIAFHKDSKTHCQLIHSLQGGPMLLPKLNLSKEAFLVYKDGIKVREAANMSGKDARIALALTDNNHMLWFLIKAGLKNSEYYGLTIPQLAEFLKYFNIKSALAYDGGSSTTFYIRLPDGSEHISIGDITSKGNRIQAKVKSVLLLLRSN